MSLAKRLNLKPGTKMRVLGKPASVDLGDVEATSGVKADAILVFVKTLADVDAECKSVIELAKNDEIAWVAYPKAGQLGADLNRDVLRKHLWKRGVQGIRQIVTAARTPRGRAVAKTGTRGHAQTIHG